MTPVATWIAATRPRTLPAAVVPVAVGVAVADTTHHVIWWHCVLALVVALALQIGTNYANDYSDGVRGTDERRVGPTRLVAGGLASPTAVRRAAWLSFLVAMAAGGTLAATTSWWVIAVGAASIAAGWFYTGGPRPYGYAGFGEVFVFCFFGLVAVVGTTYVASGELPLLAFVAALPVGFVAVALLVVNNLRDIPTDAQAGKKTLAVRLGAPRTRGLYVGCLAAAGASVIGVACFHGLAAIALLAAIPASRPARLVLRRVEGRELIAALAMTGATQLALGALLVVGLAA